jgi:hypothetical protein
MSWEFYKSNDDEVNSGLPPSSLYNPRDYMTQTTPEHDRNRFESYLEEPRFFSSRVVHSPSPSMRKIIDSTPSSFTDDGNVCYRFEEWNQEIPAKNDFWTIWVDEEIDNEKHDGSWAFANNLIWMRHRATRPELKSEKMYIAYIMKCDSPIDQVDICDPSNIIIAVCVLVKPRAVYYTLGITKSQQYQAKYKGSAFKLQQYIACIIHKNIDPLSKGLLFRPNTVMRSLMLRKLGRGVVGEKSKTGLVGGFVGSDWDIWWFQSRDEKRRRKLDDVYDFSPSIIQDNDENAIQIRFLVLNENGEQSDNGWFCFPTPFWESPSPFCNPDSPNNPQLPLVYFPIETLLHYTEVQESL